MRVRVLGSSGSQIPGSNAPAFLIDDFLLLDAGTVSRSLDGKAQRRISHIFLTHAHLDHIKGIPFLADNLASNGIASQLQILSGKDVLAIIRKNIFNNRIWPDFSILPDPSRPVLLFRAISTRETVTAGKYLIRAAKVNHGVPSYGYLVDDPATGGALLYTGDTGPTHAIWKLMRNRPVKALIIEVSFPDELTDLAIKTGHLTPGLLRAEMKKMPAIPEKIYISHLKPHFGEAIEKQLRGLGGIDLEILSDGQIFDV